jgi:hypothetical protein
MGTKQVETATVIGTITSAGGNASVVVTSGYVTGSPLTVTADVVLNDTASLVAGKIRSALGLTAAITANFAVSGTGADVILTSHTAQANDTTLNIAIDNGTCTGLTAAPTSTSTTAGAGITNGYADLAGFVDRLITTTTARPDVSRDSIIETIIENVSRSIDDYCGRRFYLNTADEARYYLPSLPSVLYCEDINAITTLKTDEDSDGVYETTWATTDYQTFPLNRVANYSPITYIKIRLNGNYVFPMYYSSIEITGKFGYCALANVPGPVKEAAYIQSMRIYMRQKAPFGVVGSAEMGTVTVIPKFDPDVEMLLRPYRRLS